MPISSLSLTTLACPPIEPIPSPTGPEASRVPKEARPVFGLPLVDAWDELGPQVCDYLYSVNVMWTAIDIVRFVEVQKDPGTPGPPFTWIGVKPGSLSHKEAKVAGVGCVPGVRVALHPVGRP